MSNLCENNPANQEVIANMNIQGIANSAQLLKDFGVDAVVNDGKIVVKSTKKTWSPQWMKEYMCEFYVV